MALTSITNWFGEEKGFNMHLDPETLHERNVRVMIEQQYRENSLSCLFLPSLWDRAQS